MIGLNAMLSGAVATASLVIALIFLRFWRSSGDRLFLFFALSFGLQAISRVLVDTVTVSDEHTPLAYLLRLVAYGLIVYAVVDKNRRRNGTRKP